MKRMKRRHAVSCRFMSSIDISALGTVLVKKEVGSYKDRGARSACDASRLFAHAAAKIRCRLPVHKPPTAAPQFPLCTAAISACPATALPNSPSATMAYGLSACCLLLLLLAGFAAPVPGFLTGFLNSPSKWILRYYTRHGDYLVSCALNFTTIPMEEDIFALEGSSCWDAVSASAGTCLKVRDCPEAQTAIWENRPLPSRCGFDGFQKIVCCPDDENGPTSPSEAACRDYENEYGYLKEIKNIIVGGENVEPLEFPHMAALGYKSLGMEGISWRCGGTLISHQFVLTAAHCCKTTLVQVRLGAIDLSSPEVESDLYGISEIIVYPGYSGGSYNSDIALLKLDRRVEFSLSVFPACLDRQHADPPSFIAAGWGSNNPDGIGNSSKLMKTTLYPFPVSDCITSNSGTFPNNALSIICAGDPEGKSDTCAGDSGGPIVVGKAPPYTVVGITSVGPNPCAGKTPSVYTRVSYYIDWIQDLVWPSHD